MAPPRLEALGLTAAGMDALGLYAALLAVVDAKELVAGHVTVGLVQELAGLVHLKVNRWDTVPPSKLSVKEFCHVVVKLRSKEFAEPLLKRKRGGGGGGEAGGHGGGEGGGQEQEHQGSHRVGTGVVSQGNLCPRMVPRTEPKWG